MIPIDQQLLNAVIHQESRGNANAVSPRGAAGIMQIMPATARDPGYGVRPLQGWDGVDPRTASVEEQIRFGTDYLNAMKRVHGSEELALAAYNAGPGAVQQYGGIPPYRETQNYVSNIMNNAGGNQQYAMNDDWMSRATPIMSDASAAMPGDDWMSRATPVNDDWMSRATEVQPQGRDMGAAAAGVQGFNAAIPFGERVAAGLGAAGAYAYDNISGLDSGTSLSDYYDEARRNQETTAENNPGAYLGGTVTGIAATLPAMSAKAITGATPTTGVRGAVNAVPEMLTSVGNWVRGGKVAADAGKVAKATNLAGKALRSAAVAAPAGAVYSYGASKNDLRSGAAVDDAISGAQLAAGLGAAVPVVGAAVEKVVKPVISKEVSALAQRAKEAFNIDLSLDQIAPSRVRDTVQKISQNLPGSSVDTFQNTQKQQWMRAVAKEIGEDADNLAPEVIQNYLKRAGSDFENVLKDTTITFNQKDINTIADIAANSRRKISTGLADVVQNNVDDFLNNLSQFKVGEARTVPGEKLASLRSQILQDLPSIDGGARQQVAKIIDKLDTVVDRHLSPEKIKTLQTARYQWRNFRTIEPLLEKSTDGTINPTQLMQKVASSKYIKAARKSIGEDNLVDLAKIGKQFMVKKGGSDTVPNLLIGGGVLGNLGLIGGAPQVAIPAMLAQGTAVVANRGYQKLVNQSPKVVSKAIQNEVSKVGASPIATLLTSGQASNAKKAIKK